MVFDLIGKHKIACGAARKGSVHLAYRETDEPMLRAQPKQMKSLGCDVEFVEAAQSRQIIGSQAVFGGLVDHRDGTLNPVSYARGLAMTAQNAGARVFCGSAVTSVARKPETWRFV